MFMALITRLARSSFSIVTSFSIQKFKLEHGEHVIYWFIAKLIIFHGMGNLALFHLRTETIYQDSNKSPECNFTAIFFVPCRKNGNVHFSTSRTLQMMILSSAAALS